MLDIENNTYGERKGGPNRMYRDEGIVLVWFLLFNGVLLLQIGATAMIGYGNKAVRRGGILIIGGTELLHAIIAIVFRGDEMMVGCGVIGCIITLLMLLLIWMLSWKCSS